MDAAERLFLERQAAKLAIKTLAPPQLIKIPACAKGIYDCVNCGKPLIPQTPNGPLKPCDGSLHFCQFATGSTTWKACKHFSLQNYHCTHSGGTCSGSGMKWNKYHFGLTPDTRKEGMKRLC